MLAYASIPTGVIDQVKQADGLALEARAAAAAGDHQQAAKLRAAFDAIYDALEVELYGETTAEYLGIMAPAPELLAAGMDSKNQHSNKFF